MMMSSPPPPATAAIFHQFHQEAGSVVAARVGASLGRGVGATDGGGAAVGGGGVLGAAVGGGGDVGAAVGAWQLSEADASARPPSVQLGRAGFK